MTQQMWVAEIYTDEPDPASRPILSYRTMTHEVYRGTRRRDAEAALRRCGKAISRRDAAGYCAVHRAGRAASRGRIYRLATTYSAA